MYKYIVIYVSLLIWLVTCVSMLPTLILQYRSDNPLLYNAAHPHAPVQVSLILTCYHGEVQVLFIIQE